MKIFHSLKNLLGGDAPSPLAPIENKSTVETPSAAPQPPPAAGPTPMDSITSGAGVSHQFSILETERRTRHQQIEIEADSVRRFNRAETARLIASNRLAEVERQKQQTATDTARQKEKNRPLTWEELHLPYITGFSHGERFASRAELPGVTKQLVLALIQHGKLEVLQAKTSNAIAPAILQWESAFCERSSLNHDAVRKKLLDIVLTNEAAVKSGNPAGILPAFDREENDKLLTLQRSACRQKQKAANEACRPPILLFAAALQDAARDIAVDTIAKEKILAAEWDVPFQPSPWTKKIILIGFDLRQRIELEAGHGAASSPADILFGLLDSRKKP
jgi:hypothetical protein